MAKIYISLLLWPFLRLAQIQTQTLHTQKLNTLRYCIIIIFNNYWYLNLKGLHRTIHIGQNSSQLVIHYSVIIVTHNGCLAKQRKLKPVLNLNEYGNKISATCEQQCLFQCFKMFQNILT